MRWVIRKAPFGKWALVRRRPTKNEVAYDDDRSGGQRRVDKLNADDAERAKRTKR